MKVLNDKINKKLEAGYLHGLARNILFISVFPAQLSPLSLPRESQYLLSFSCFLHFFLFFSEAIFYLFLCFQLSLLLSVSLHEKFAEFCGINYQQATVIGSDSSVVAPSEFSSIK